MVAPDGELSHLAGGPVRAGFELHALGVPPAVSPDGQSMSSITGDRSLHSRSTSRRGTGRSSLPRPWRRTSSTTNGKAIYFTHGFCCKYANVSRT